MFYSFLLEFISLFLACVPKLPLPDVAKTKQISKQTKYNSYTPEIFFHHFQESHLKDEVFNILI